MLLHARNENDNAAHVDMWQCDCVVTKERRDRDDLDNASRTYKSGHRRQRSEICGMNREETLLIRVGSRDTVAYGGWALKET